jgi:uncharacterized protein (TIGR03435 family)
MSTLPRTTGSLPSAQPRRLILRATAAAGMLLVLASVLRAQIVVPQQGETLPTFEVETVKPSSRDLGRSFHTHIWWNDNNYRTENTSLRDLIRDAFNARSASQLAGGPDALLDSRWDINAKIGDDAFAQLKKLPRQDRDRAIHLMIQALLRDRFGLKAQVAIRELPVFNLVIEKGGSKLQPAARQPAPGAADPGAPAQSGGPHISTNIRHDHGTMTVTDASLAELTAMLGHQSELDGRMVIDKTGLTGPFNWTLEWQPQRLDATADVDPTGPPLLTALKEQLGLRLEPAKGPVQVVVVDAVSSPTPN